MRFSLVLGAAVAAGIALQASGVKAAQADCDAKFEEYLDRLSAEIMPPYQKSEYMGFILGGYQRCIANQPDPWDQASAYFEKKPG